MTLQKQPSTNPQRQENFVFTIEAPNTLAVQINSISDPSSKDILVALYNTAEVESKRIANEKKIEVFKNLLKDL